MKYDIFIAYHNRDDIKGSYRKACEIKEYLEKQKYSCYLCEVDKFIKFVDTPKEAAESRLFLLVANSKIATSDGKIDSEHINAECDRFMEVSKKAQSARVYCYDGLTPEKANNLHELFDGTDHVVENSKNFHHAFERIAQWIGKTRGQIVFTYDAETGIMRNPEDGRRNISFREDTLNLLMEEVYNKIISLSSVKDADEFFYQMGESRGKSFFERAHGILGEGNSFEDKIKKAQNWASFDSRVGWGNISININKNGGGVSIIEAILVAKKQGVKTCEFIRGYCSGVLSAIFDPCQIVLECDAKHCPLQMKSNRLDGQTNICKFKIRIKQ